MQRTKNSNAKRLRGTLKKLLVWALLFAMMAEALSVGSLAAPVLELVTGGKVNGSNSSLSGSSTAGKLDTDKMSSELMDNYLSYIKKDLLMKIEDYELSGPVEVVLTFSDDSVIDSYLNSGANAKQTFDEYRLTDEAKKLESSLEANQEEMLDLLEEKGLIDKVYNTYTNILDGAFVLTTYENLEEICGMKSIRRVTISNSYNPASAVENPVNVYETGIFNSGNVSYTGKGTLVAILDTGCDYTHTAFTTHTVQSPKYNRDDIEKLLPLLKANTYGDPLEAREVYYGNITGGKIAYGYDYADLDPDIMPYSNSHGTHVAGIIGGKDDKITGVAIDTQFAIMKVFSDYKAGAKDGWIIAALEDSVVLGVDAINMSLGTSCGFTVERDADDIYKNELYDKIEKAGISLVVAASNDHSSAFGGAQGNTNKTDNPDSATVGAPSTYPSAMSVASINGNKDYYMFANGEQTVFFTESFDTGANEYDFFEMLGIKEGETVSYEYVTVPGLGLAINYSGLDLKGKIALVKRGDITFEEKVQFAQEAGAIAVIIYNNIFGTITMTIGNNAKIPAVSIGKDEGDILASRPSGTIVFDRSNVAGPFMSDFSSWGPTPDLKLKPDITAHGGNIMSSIIGGYDEMSGTSMAAPNMCGITVLIRQYVKDKYKDLSTVEVRDLVNQLCMSTATIALDQKGNPYSPRKQGAGIADIVKSTTTEAYLHVDGLNKTKLELGADPKRTGVYTLPINLTNLSETKAASYKLGHITMTESVSTSDPEFVAEMAYILAATAEYKVEGGKLENGVVTVEPGKTAKITATITLTKEDKSYLNSLFENGMFVEGFLTFDNTEENGVDLNAPFLAFYGDWGEPPIFDIDYYEVETEAHNNAIDDEDKIKADYYATTPLANYYYDYIIPLGTYLYEMDESEYSPIPATREHSAISYYDDCLSGIYGTFAGLLRNAKELRVTMVNTTTGEVVYDVTEYNCYKAHYNGAPIPYASKIDFKSADFDSGKILGWNNNKFEVTLTAKLDWEGGDNVSDTYSYSFYMDYEAPVITSSEFRTEYDKGREENRYYLDLMVYDNHYAMACRPVTVYDLYYEDKGEERRTVSPLTQYPIPIYQENRGEATKVTLEITDYLDIIANSDMPSGISIYLNDYALNTATYFIPFPGTEDDSIEFDDEGKGIELDINETCDLREHLLFEDSANKPELDFLKNLKWSSSDESVVTVRNGKIEALKTGSAVIQVTSESWTIKTVTGEGKDQKVEKTPVYKSIVINVTDKVCEDDPDAGKNVDIEELKFSHYKTVFAFNNHIDSSKIGTTGSINYFGGNNSIEFYPSEQIQLFPLLTPWNIAEDRYEFKWTSSNEKVATVDENGIVTAEAEGKARITLNIIIDGKTSLMAARLSLEVKSEFIIENRKLVAYKGKGGDVVIPDDEGIMIIGKYAFSHFFLDNEKEVEKDEDGYYDMDLKKRPIGNDTVTSVVIPEDVETIEKYAFYNCSKLTKVTLPESCKNVEASAFAECDVLENINLGNVNIIHDMAFYNCESLTCDDLGGIDLSNAYTIGLYGFSKTALTSVKLPYLSRVGESAFADCKNLTKVELGQRTRVSKGMFENTPIEEIVIYADVVDDNAFKGCTELKSVVIKNDMTYLGQSAFADCKKLSDVKFEGEVESIADFAFSNCESLSEFTLPDGKVALGNAIFGSAEIEKIIFLKNTEIVSLGITLFEKVREVEADVSASDFYKQENGIIYSKDGKQLVLALPNRKISSVVVPATVETICSGAFSSVTTLITLKFEENSKLKEIGAYAFANCSSLILAELPKQPVEIGNNAFYFATALKDIDLSNVTYVGDLAFSNTAITEADLSADNVYIGERAFVGCSKLKTVTLGKNAQVGDYAFYQTPITKVDLKGDAKIGAFAFAECAYLTSFDFEDITGTLGDFSFGACIRLTAVSAPKITGIGEGAFANCVSLSKFTAPSLKTIGAKAFALLSDKLQTANSLVNVDLPELVSVGDYAFYGALLLESFNAPKLEAIGEASFYVCQKLKTITYSDKLTDIPKNAFYYCLALSGLDFTNIVNIGEMALCGVILPAELVLPNVEFIDKLAFAEFKGADGENISYLETISAPKLKSLGDQAFGGCLKLKSFYAPAIEELGEYVFAGSAIEEIEVSSALKSVHYLSFYMCDNLKTFYATVDGKKVYDAEFDNFMISDGVLYTVRPFGYTLSCYPVMKQDKEFTVKEGTLRIEYCAFMENKFIEKVTLPSSLNAIANFAFYGCEALKTVVFNSYYAPVLEGTLNGSAIDINASTVDKFPGFDKLYKYDYYFAIEGFVIRPLYYRNFVGTVGSDEVHELTAIIPENNEGYDALLYNAYFTIAEENSGKTMGKYAIAFIEAVNKLPLNIDRFDKLLLDDAIVAFNALEKRADEKEFVSAEIFEKFHTLRSDYNVDLVTSKIAHIFDVDTTKYSFDLIKSANALYAGLSADEKARIENAAVLTQKTEELKAAFKEKFGVDVDFSLEYEAHLPKEEDPGANDGTDTAPVDVNGGNGPDITKIIIAVAAAVLIAAGIVIFVVKNKKKATPEAAPEATEEAAADNTEATESAEDKAEATEEAADNTEETADNNEEAAQNEETKNE